MAISDMHGKPKQLQCGAMSRAIDLNSGDIAVLIFYLIIDLLCNNVTQDLGTEIQASFNYLTPNKVILKAAAMCPWRC